MTDEHTPLLRGLLAAVNDLDALPHAGPAGRVFLAAAVAGRGCSDGEVAFNASMPVADVRVLLQSMMERCQHVPALLTAKTNPIMAPPPFFRCSGAMRTRESALVLDMCSSCCAICNDHGDVLRCL